MSTSAERADKLVESLFGRGITGKPKTEGKPRVFKQSLAKRMMESRRKDKKLLEPFLPKKGRK